MVSRTAVRKPVSNTLAAVRMTMDSIMETTAKTGMMASPGQLSEARPAKTTLSTAPFLAQNSAAETSSTLGTMVTWTHSAK